MSRCQVQPARPTVTPSSRSIPDRSARNADPCRREPNKLALTADGKFLWVALDGAAAVRKVDLTPEPRACSSDSAATAAFTSPRQP